MNPFTRPPILSRSLPVALVLLMIILMSAGCAASSARLGDQLGQEGKWDEAVSAYRQAVKKDPYDQDLADRLATAKVHAAEQHYALGHRHMTEGNVAEALRELKQAVGLDPSRREHQAALSDALRLKEAREHLQAGKKLQSVGRVDDALAAFEQAVELDPSLTEALTGITAVTANKQAARAIGGSSQPITLRFQNANLKEVFEIVARSAGVNVIFDKEVRDEPITIFIKDMPFDEALNMILNTNQLISQRVGPDTLLILPNTKQKQAQYQDLMMRTFYLSNAKAKDVVNLVRTMLESKRVYVDEKINALVIRDEPAKLSLAERVINSIDRQEPEVELDVEVLEVDRTKSLKYGLNYAKSAGAGIVPPGFTGTLSTGPAQFTYQQLTNLGPESYLFTFPASVILDFFKQESDAKTLAAPKLRVLNNRQASISVGDKQPILLSTTNVLPGQAATGAVPTTSTVTSIEFKDVGVKLTVEPTIHLMDEITLKLKVEVTRLGDQVTLQASPEIKQFRFGTRSAETVLMMKDDETVILAGLIQNEQRRTQVKMPWIDQIPLLGALLTSTTEDTITTEVILSITPHIVRKLTPPGPEVQAYWSGTETNYATSQLFLPRPVPVVHSTDVPLTGQPSGPHSRLAPPSGRPGASTLPEVASPAPLGATSRIAPDTQLASVPSTPTRNEGLVSLRPSDLTTAVGQEFRLDLSTDKLESLAQSVMIVTFDTNVLQLVRVTPGVAAIVTTVNPEGMVLTVRRQPGTGVGSGPLATLFFQAKTAGTFPIGIRSQSAFGADGASLSPITEGVMVQVR